MPSNIKTTFIKYVSLNILGMIGLSCYILADTFFVAQGIGPHGLTALNLAIPIYSFIHGTGLMIGMGGATRFSISKSKTVFTQALYLVFCTAILFCIAGLFLSGRLASLLGADHTAWENTKIYMNTILCFSPMFLLNNVILCFVRNDGSPRLSMTAMLIGSFSNIILDYIFIFPFGMGMLGAALATGVAPVISLLVLSLHFKNKKNTFHPVRNKMSAAAAADITSLGISALITEVSSGIVMIIFNLIILKLKGNIGVAAYGIIANLALVVMSIFTGISQGIQPIISRSYGIGDRKSIKEIMRYGFTTATIMALAVYAVSLLGAEQIAGAFNKDADIQLTQIAVNGMWIYFTAFIFAGINILCATYFSAADKPKKAFIISLLRGFVIIIPMAYVLSAIWGMNGVWAAMTCTEAIVLLVSLRMYLPAKKEKRRFES